MSVQSNIDDQSEILVVSWDQMRLQVHRLILGTYFHVESAGRMAEAGALLGRLHFVHSWRETTMTDGRPLTLTIQSNAGRWHITCDKAREGLWAQGPVRICRNSSRVVAAIAGADLSLGPAAGWAVRQLFASGATFELTMRDNGMLRISTAGWSGDF